MDIEQRIHRVFINKALKNKKKITQTIILSQHKITKKQSYALIKKKEYDVKRGCSWAPTISSEYFAKLLINLEQQDKELIAIIRLSISSRDYWLYGLDGDANREHPNLLFIVYNSKGEWYTQRGRKHNPVTLKINK